MSTEDSIEAEKNKLIAKDISSFDPLITNIKDSLWKQRTQNSTSIDVIAVYLKGQKILYIESKVFCESLLYRFMLPTIAISSLCTVLSLATSTLSYGSVLVSSLTALNSCLLAIISYLKLDAKAESYRVSAYKFDKLQTKCEFFSGRLLFSEKKKPATDAETKEVHAINDSMEGFLESLEKEIEEIKEVNQFVLPQHVRRNFPKLYTTNVFAEIKLRGNALRVYIYDLNIIYNKLAELKIKKPEELGEIEELNKKKDNLVLHIIRARDSYLTIDQEFTNEINECIYRYTCWDMLMCRRHRKPADNSKAQYEKDLAAYVVNKGWSTEKAEKAEKIEHV